MAQTSKKDLGFLGEKFQYKLTHEFMENHTFFEDLSGIIDQNMFIKFLLLLFQVLERKQ